MNSKKKVVGKIYGEFKTYTSYYEKKKLKLLPANIYILFQKGLANPWAIVLKAKVSESYKELKFLSRVKIVILKHTYHLLNLLLLIV